MYADPAITHVACSPINIHNYA